MKDTRLIMGMPITVDIAETQATATDLECVFDFFVEVDEQFSTYKDNSEISAINRGELGMADYSPQMRYILEECERAKEMTGGYFDIEHQGKLDPSGLVKGWSIREAVKLIKKMGYKHYFVDAGGDIQTSHQRADGKPWRVGIRNPFNRQEQIQILSLSGQGVATSGTYIRGLHVYNPHEPSDAVDQIVSLTVVGPNIYEADIMATAALAMGYPGLSFIQSLPEFDAYMINKEGRSWWTTGFRRYVATTANG